MTEEELSRVKKEYPEYKGIKGHRLKDLTYNKFNRLLVLYRGEPIITDAKKRPQWICLCDCGNIVKVSGDNLVRNHTTSCGCYMKQRITECNSTDYRGKKFGLLTPIEPTNKRRKYQIIWKCKCDCGNITYVASSDFSHTASCGCLISKQEAKIKTLLFNNGIEYKQHYYITNLSYYADFYVNEKYFIEFDGIQHFKYRNDTGWNTKENFEKTRERDLIKNKYCFDNNIPLIRIPYDADYTLDDLKLETTRFLLTPENEEEYYESRKQ